MLADAIPHLLMLAARIVQSCGDLWNRRLGTLRAHPPAVATFKSSGPTSNLNYRDGQPLNGFLLFLSHLATRSFRRWTTSGPPKLSSGAENTSVREPYKSSIEVGLFSMAPLADFFCTLVGLFTSPPTSPTTNLPSRQPTYLSTYIFHSFEHI